MDNGTSRGSKRVADEARTAGSEDATNSTEQSSTTADTSVAAHPPSSPKDETNDEEENEGDSIARRGDLELCKRKDVSLEKNGRSPDFMLACFIFSSSWVGDASRGLEQDSVLADVDSYHVQRHSDWFLSFDVDSKHELTSYVVSIHTLAAIR